FGGGGCVKVLVGRDQRHWPEPGILALLAGFERSGQLDGIVGPEAVLAGPQHGIGEEGRGQLDDAVTLGQVPTEMAEDRPGLGGRQVAAVLPAGGGGRGPGGGGGGGVETGDGPGGGEGV